MMHFGTKMGAAPRARRPLGYRGLLLVGIALASACNAPNPKGPESHSQLPPQPSAAGSPSTAPVLATQGPVSSAQKAAPSMASAQPPAANPSAEPAKQQAVVSNGLALPQDVCGVLQSNGCISCHQSQLQGGAPMPLQWRADLTGKARDGSAMSDKLLVRLQDARSPMPPVTTMRPMLSADHMALLRKWVEGGMPGTEGSECEAVDAPISNQPAWATQPWPEGECEYIMTVGAHGAVLTPLAEDPSAYEVPEGETTYHCFYEKVPWGDKPVQALATRAHFDGEDDKKIVHHTVLSALTTGSGITLLGGDPPSGAGDHKECPNQSGSTVGSWAPGSQLQNTLPAETGLLMPSGTDAYVQLQVHYNNAKAGMKSRFSFEICATSKMRPNTAAVHWLGYENATTAVPLAGLGPDLQPALDNQGGGVAIGRCKAKQRARLLWAWPHMHLLGRHEKVEILRKDGTRQVIHDRPFDFHEQPFYTFDDLWIEKGESIQTTCTWDPQHKIVWGLASDDEMCLANILAYPIGALAGEGAEKGIVGGDLSCAGTL